MSDRDLLLAAFAAGVAGVDPEAAAAAAASRIDIAEVDRVLLVAAGKAAAAMTRGFVSVRPPDDGVVVAPAQADVPLPVVVGGHPLPTEGSIDGAKRALDLASRAGPEDLVVVLISGGGSAILAAPAAGLSLADLRATNDALLASGADIAEVNTVRKHLSAIKGGRLAAAASRTRLVTLVLSDVVGDPLDIIASGPTVPDPSTFADALEVIERRRLCGRVPPSVIRHLEAGRAGELPETPKAPHPRHEIRVIGSGPIAAEAATAFLRARGVPARIVSTHHIGDARAAALAALAAPADDDEVLIFAGETTVTVTGAGRGGRNQEAALAAAIAIAGSPVTFLAAGTDGIDGPTEAAGAVVDGGTIERGNKLGLDAEASLADNDAYSFLEKTGDLVVTGPTGTNVADLWLIRRQIDEPDGLWAAACEI